MSTNSPETQRDPFRVNNKLFSIGGTIGRWQYFLNTLKLHILILPLGAITVISVGTINSGGSGAVLGAPFAIGSAAGLIYLIIFAVSNNAKRLRDIRGTLKDEPMAIIGTHLAGVVVAPAGLIALLLLHLMPKNSGGNLITPIANQVGSKISSAMNNLNSNKSNPEDQLSQLFDLKNKGAISEDEYLAKKEQLLKKVA